jgi:orotidine-5'-phosphate decarboxylase
MHLTPPSRPIFCAFDTTDLEAATALARVVAASGGGIKVGNEFFTAHGPEGVRRLTRNGKPPLFLDLKFHDIPNTVAAALKAALTLTPFLVNVHVAGGPAMLRAATAAAASAGAERPQVLGVTVLTSLDDADLAAVGLGGPASERALAMARLAQDCGLDGVVCSAHELAAIRAACGRGFLLVVPGIRPAGAAPGDQKRVMTPARAMALGADYLVIGRPITAAADPALALDGIAAELAA